MSFVRLFYGPFSSLLDIVCPESKDRVLGHVGELFCLLNVEVEQFARIEIFFHGLLLPWFLAGFSLKNCKPFPREHVV